MQTFSVTIDESDEGKRLDLVLALKLPDFSRTRLQSLIREGAVKERDRIVEMVAEKTIAGLTYTVEAPDPVSAIPKPEHIPIEVFFEDDDLIVVNKPAGMAAHPAPGSENGTLVNALLHHCSGNLSGIGGVERPGIVHRIDKFTTGVLVVAKSEKAHVGLSELFAKHDTVRTYTAFTVGTPRPLVGTIDVPIVRSQFDRKKMAVPALQRRKNARHAITHYRVKETFGRISKRDKNPSASLIECRLETGRTHQIRVHLNHIGAPIFGDQVYGRQKTFKAYGIENSETIVLSRQALHASVLGFVHPITEKFMKFEAPLPNDLVELQQQFRQLPKE